LTLTKKKIQWRRLLLLMPRLAALAFLGPFLIDWTASRLPAYAGLAHDVIGLSFIMLLVVFVAIPGLEACGEKIDRSIQQKGLSMRWTCGLALLCALLIGLNRLRYHLAIDAVPLHNSLYNILMGVIGAAGYGLMRYLDRRKSDTG
jgi:uncharacterized membrane protein YfcA